MKTKNNRTYQIIVTALLVLSSVQSAFCSSNTDFFRSKASGNWNSTATWETSATGGNPWSAATLTPDLNSQGITIKSGHTVTLVAGTSYSTKSLTISAGGILLHQSTATLAVSGSGTTFTIQGTYVLNGTQPTFASGSKCKIVAGGIVRVDDNAGVAESDNFAWENASVTFASSSIYQWNTTIPFDMRGPAPGYTTIAYLGSFGSGNTPTFKVSASVFVGMGTGAQPSTFFNCKFEVASGVTVTFLNNGTKYFRDGIGGAGIITNDNSTYSSVNTGVLQINGTSAVIDGTVTLNIFNSSYGTLDPNTDFEIGSGASVTISGSPTINIGNATSTGADFVNRGTLTLSAGTTINLTYGNFYLYGTMAGTGTLTASSTNTNFTFSANTGGSAGSLYFTPGANTVHDFTMKFATSSGNTISRVNLGSALTVDHNLTLTNDILVTGSNLFTWNNNGGTLTLPASYSDSYIATCTSSGTGLTLTTPFDGSVGFRINNVSGNSYQMFPVSADFNTPNRMSINMNNSTSDNFTVVVGKGDVVNTPLARVSRIWYVKEGTAGGTTASMRLYFTKRNWSTYPFGSASNDEIEDGFLYDDAHFLQENYSYQFVNNAKSPSGDVNTGYASNVTYTYGTELFAQYTKGTSVDLFGATNGVTGFTRFTVANANGIILPVDITNFKASYQSGKVQIGWTAVNETNIASYNVERSSDAENFTTLKVINSRNNGALQNVYTLFDEQPKSGINYYRLKIVDKNGLSQYSQTISINISNLKTSVVVQPNPVQDRVLHFQTNNITAGKYNVAVYNSVGQQVLTTSVTIEDGTALQDIALPPSVPVGNYFLRLFNQNNLFTTKFIIAK